MAAHEVTQELYHVVMGKNPAKWVGPRNAIEMCDWDEAQEFCTKVTKALRERKLLTAKQRIRLPTEAEWEYCCRAGTTTAWSFGNEEARLGEYCWYDKNAKGNDPPVGKKNANPWGLYDMHGYNWEWCQDTWHETYEGAPADSQAWETAGEKKRVIRSGSWGNNADASRSAARARAPVNTRSDTIGFRCVLDEEK
jgi:formylglycine-generating enzyme required for sulfatase activity